MVKKEKQDVPMDQHATSLNTTINEMVADCQVLQDILILYSCTLELFRNAITVRWTKGWWDAFIL